MDADPWDVRIEQTGCSQENERLQICHYDTGDWRKCLNEMKAFRECWQKHNNAQRVQTVGSRVSSVDNDHNLTGTTHEK